MACSLAYDVVPGMGVARFGCFVQGRIELALQHALAPPRSSRHHDDDVAQWLEFDAYTLRVRETMAALMPQLRTVRTDDGRIVLQRGNATARVDRDPAGVSVVLFQRDAIVLRATTHATPQSAYELAADLVGFFCGASLCTFSLYPHRGPKPVLRRRRRWNQRF